MPMNDDRQSTQTTVNDNARTAEEQALARHLELLRERFPLPEAGELARRRSPKPSLVVLAVLMLAAGVVWFDPAYRTEHFSTAIGERRTLALADGSRVTLNTNSRLEMAWHLRSRRAALPVGQALFDVEHARFRPFHVDAGAAQVRVVGTAFDVRRDDRHVAVTVLRGRVEVSAPGAVNAPVLLTAEQRVRMSGDAVGAIERVDVAAQTAWKDGRLLFDRMPLAAALAEIQRYRRTPIALGDRRLAELRISGVFSTDNTDDLLQLLPQILPVKLVNASDGSVSVIAARK